jgi:hypothetical protein
MPNKFVRHGLGWFGLLWIMSTSFAWRHVFKNVLKNRLYAVQTLFPITTRSGVVQYAYKGYQTTEKLSKSNGRHSRQAQSPIAVSVLQILSAKGFKMNNFQDRIELAREVQKIVPTLASSELAALLHGLQNLKIPTRSKVTISAITMFLLSMV